MKRGGECDFIPLAFWILLKIELFVLFFHNRRQGNFRDINGNNGIGFAVVSKMI